MAFVLYDFIRLSYNYNKINFLFYAIIIPWMIKWERLKKALSVVSLWCWTNCSVFGGKTILLMPVLNMHGIQTFFWPLLTTNETREGKYSRNNYLKRIAKGVKYGIGYFFLWKCKLSCWNVCILTNFDHLTVLNNN